jgi:choline kinase
VRAVILAAGRGSRLGAMTDDRPKCMVELFGRPLVEWQMDALREAGVAEIGIVRGYRGEMLDGLRATAFDSPRWHETNMVRSLAAAAGWLSEGECIVSYSDIFYPSSAVSALMASDGAISVSYDAGWRSLWSRRFVDPMLDAESFELDREGWISDIGRKPAAMERVSGQYMGLLRFTPAGWGWVEDLLARLDPIDVDRLDMTGMLRALVASGRRIRGVRFDGVWGEVDSRADLELYHSDPLFRLHLAPDDRRG